MHLAAIYLGLIDYIVFRQTDVHSLWSKAKFELVSSHGRTFISLLFLIKFEHVYLFSFGLSEY